MKLNKEGLYLIDKPKGLSSHDVVDKVRALTGERRVGHAGTLDPNATGLLIVGVGRENTRKLGEITLGTTKVYVAEIFLGEERDTDDVEGRITKKSKFKNKNHESKLKIDEIKKVLGSFVGEQMQTPPVYSAIKLKGKKAYELARKGRKVEVDSRLVTIYSIKVLNYKYPILKIETKVSSGTYIRALARDIGRKLGTFGYLRNLRRTRIGKFRVEDAILLE